MSRIGEAWESPFVPSSLPEPPSQCRKATLGDGLILIAAIAVSFAVTRSVLQDPLLRWYLLDKISRVGVVHRLVTYVALIFTLSYFAIRLRRPRPPLREIFRQPGMIACSAVGVSIAFGFLLLLPRLVTILFGSVYPQTPLSQIVGFTVSNMLFAHAIAGAWLTLWLSGSWKAEAGWIDWLGRVLGCFWILSLFFVNYQFLWI
jgi:hypothetical protein